MVTAANLPLAVNFTANTQTQDLIRGAFDSVRRGPAQRPVGATAAPARGEARGAAEAPAADGEAPASGPRPAPGNPERREPLLKAVNGDIPTFTQCPDPAAAVYALQLFEPYDRLKPVFILTPDCYRVAERFGQRKAAVVLPAVIPFEPNTRTRVNAPAIMAKAGAKIACRPSTDSVSGYETLLFQMGELIKAGLDRDDALRAITLSPAEMLGLAARIGSIEAGRDGNLVLMDGDPFSVLTQVKQVLLEGKVVYDASRSQVRH